MAELSGTAGSERPDGWRAVVTGASSGIGAAVARRLAARGARLVLVARDRARLEAVTAELGGERGIALPCDVADPVAVAAMVAAAWDRLGAIDVLVHSAGVSKPAALPELDADRWHEVIETNLSGAFHVCREVGLRMRSAGGGSIVTVASESAQLGEPGFVAYCASKGGVVALTKALAAELGPAVRVNAVCPGTVNTPMVHRDLAATEDPAAARRAVERRIPLGRLAEPDEVAEAVVFLAGATFAQGTALSLDGGTTAMLAGFIDG